MSTSLICTAPPKHSVQYPISSSHPCLWTPLFLLLKRTSCLLAKVWSMSNSLLSTGPTKVYHVRSVKLGRSTCVRVVWQNGISTPTPPRKSLSLTGSPRRLHRGETRYYTRWKVSPGRSHGTGGASAIGCIGLATLGVISPTVVLNAQDAQTTKSRSAVSGSNWARSIR